MTGETWQCARPRCNRPLNRRTAIWTRIGWMCRRHADRAPSYLRRTR